jgi:Resolvase, N terminal domain.
LRVAVGFDAQLEQQDRAIARYGLAEGGLEWSVASSGWTSAWRTPTWEAMVASAQAGAFDVLVVGYVSRFLRNLKQTLIAVEDHLHAAGVVVLRFPCTRTGSMFGQSGQVHRRCGDSSVRRGHTVQSARPKLPAGHLRGRATRRSVGGGRSESLPRIQPL